MTKYKLAIDFGTTNSAIATFVEETRAGKTIEIPGISQMTRSGEFLIPTLIYVCDGKQGEVLIGQAVRAQGWDYAHGNRLFTNFKRGIGNDTLFDARLIDGVPWTNKDAGQQFLRHLLNALPFASDEIEQLVITVPVASFEHYTTWLEHTIQGLPADRIRIVDESTAAALGYAITEPGAMVLMIDFGSGTLDLSLVRLPDTQATAGKVLFSSGAQPQNKATVIAKAGITLGGSDIDQWLATEVLHRTGIDLDSLGAGFAALLSTCEQAKINLSTEESTIVAFQTEDRVSHTISLNRSDLETLMAQHGFFTSLRQALEKVMGFAHQKGVYREDIHHVLLVGGTALIPSVQQTLDSYFRAITERHRKIFDMPEWPSLTWTVENTTIRVDKPFTAIVEGALQVSAGFGLEDRLGHGYGLRVFDSKAGGYRFDEVIPMGSPYPTQKPIILHLGVLHPHQKEVELILGQLGADVVTPLNAESPLIISLSSPGERGKEALEAAFSVDSTRHLRLTITDSKTGQILYKDSPVIGPKGKNAQERSSPIQMEADKSLTNSAPVLMTGKGPRRGMFKKVLEKIFDHLPQGMRGLGAALQSEDALVRFDAAKILSERGDRESRLILEEILSNGSAPQRASVVWNLSRTSWFSAEPLIRRALSDDDPRVREAAIFALCKMRVPEAYRLVMEVLRMGNDPMRMAAVWGLSTHPDAGAVPILELSLQAENPEIRAQALEVLGATASPEAISMVKQAVSDPDLEVKYAAVLSWVELAEESCFEELALVIVQATGWARRAILRGVFHATNYLGMNVAQSSGADVLIAAFETALKDDLPETRINASLPLAWMRHPRAEQVLLEGFHREKDSDVQAHILANVVHLMSPVAEKLMAKALESDDLLVRQTVEYLQKTIRF